MIWILKMFGLRLQTATAAKYYENFITANE